MATKQIWALNNAMKLVEKGNETLDEIENGYMSPFSDIGYLKFSLLFIFNCYYLYTIIKNHPFMNTKIF